MIGLINRYFLEKPRFRRFVTRLLEGDHDFDVELLGTRLRVNSIKEHGYLRSSRFLRNSQILRDEAPAIIHMAAILCDGDTFVDVGANVGIYSLTLARLHHILPNTRFYAFEANPDTFKRLAANAEALGIHAHNVALSDHDGKLDFVGGAVSHVFTTVENTSSIASIHDGVVSVPCRRLDGLDLIGQSLVMKIDVEGQEKNVLDGAKGLFEAGRVKAVFLDGYKEKGVESFLRKFGFTFFEARTLMPVAGDVWALLALRSPS